MRLIFADVAKVWPAMHSSVITRLGAHVLIHRQANVGLITTTRHRAIVGVRATAAARPSTRVRYVKRPDSKKDLFYYATPPPEALHSITNLELEEAFVEVSDLRAHNTMDWQRNGFQLVQFSNFQDLVWDDEDQVRQYHLCHERLLQVT